MNPTASYWEQVYLQAPLALVPVQFANMRQSPFTMQYLARILGLCPEGGRACEIGFGSGYAAVWLSLRGVRAEGIDCSPLLVERARQANNVLGGTAQFRVGDLFCFYQEDAPRYSVIHHQGVLERFTVPQIRAALAQQVASADWVVFSVASVFYPFEPEAGDERLLPLEEWERILAPFSVEELRYYGDPQHGEREHVFCVLRGQEATPALRKRFQVAEFPPGISAIVHTRNEAAQIAACLETLRGWTDEVIVCDMESADQTAEIARTLADQVLNHPPIANFDRARNVSAMRANYRFIFYLDADERVPPELGRRLREAALNQGDDFEAMLVPFRHHFAGRWLQCLYPGYTMPRLFKNGRFFFNTRLHTGAEVKGHTTAFPADNPELALVHYSYASMAHYLEKLNRYTDGEAANMHRDGQTFAWHAALRHFVLDLRDYYDRRGAGRDGPHGFAYSFLSGFYRFEQHIKLFEKRFHAQQLQQEELAVPQSVEQMLEYMLSVVRERPRPQAPAIQVRDTPEAAPLVWSGPVLDPSGYGEESRHFALALEEAGVPAAVQVIPWSDDVTELSEREQASLHRMAERPAVPGFIQITHNFAPQFARHPQAGVAIGRTLFETDRLPQAWVQACNRMDYVWVASEFNRQTFAQAGVDARKLVVVPECFDPAAFLSPAAAAPNRWTRPGEFTFLAVFDWTLHKGWDVLLRAFLQAFEGRSDRALLLKVWSTMGYSNEQVRLQAADLVRRELGLDLEADGRVRFVQERLSQTELIGLYRDCDAYVLPSRGEGWGRPYMEAMACGKPVLATGWSGNTAFMTADNSYLFECDLVPVPEAGWREIPTYRGHRWSEPRLAHVVAQMQRVADRPEEAKGVGERARTEVTAGFSRETVGRLMAREIERIREERQPRPVLTEFAKRQEPTERQDKAEHGEEPPMRIRWEGVPFQWHSLAHVNREACIALLAHPEVEMALVPTDRPEFDPAQEPAFTGLAPLCFARLSGPADIHVRHFFPPRLEKPDEGRFVLIQPWEYGFLPTRWIQPILENVDEVWCYSSYVRDVYLASGIPAEKLQVVPLGVDTATFHPGAPPFAFTTEPGAAMLRPDGPKRFTFLFVGGTLDRKGIDILLEAYLKAFSAFDEVCLVIKDTGTKTVYRGQNEREKILARVGDEFHAPLVYLEDDLSAHQLAGLYTAADCLVQPYRGEGFCLPVLEAMACGIPAIVPEGGPTDDFVDASVGWRVPAEKRPLGNNRVGDWECTGPLWMFEVAVTDLARQMRAAFLHPDEANRKGQAAAQRVRGGWTWQHTGDRMLERMKTLQAQTPATKKTLASPQTASLKLEAKRARGRKRDQEETELLGAQIVDRRGTAVGSRPVRLAPTISLCMIVKNEERVLDACLTSVKPYVDEIVLVDTGSTDRTVEIAQAHGVKLFHFPWINDFSAARNVSLEHATGDWLFWMDADDTLPEECGRRLHELVMLAEDKVTGFLMQVHIPPAQGEHGFTIVDHVKLFRNRPQHRFEGRIHEQILEAIYRQGGSIERSNLYVVHSGYDYSPEGQQRKRERDLTILELDLADRPTHPFVWFNIGMTAFHLKESEKAISALEQCLAFSKPHESIVRKVYAMLAGAHLEQRDMASARTRIDQGLALFPNDPELLFRAGIIYRELGNLPVAERNYLRLLNSRESGHIDSLDVSMTTYKAHHNLALIYQDMNQVKEAEEQWQAALAHSPDFAPSLLGLGELCLKLCRFDEARTVLERLSKVAPEQAEVFRRHLAQAEGLS